ncbi:MAG: adenylate/guanylate cyclase domain-containing protein [Candidatus Gracilibacteria bacterium]|nr:adenylate/guanylate cyclase domain-containing protein [Candidatus Gracilibacteria bacterium]
MKYNFLKNKNILSIFLAFIVLLIILFINELSIGKIVDKNIQKSLFNFSKNNIDSRLVLVQIDDKTVEKLGRFPFDRASYVNLIKNLNKAGAAVIGFDVIFADKTNDISDDSFAKAIKDSNKVVLGGATLSIQPENNLYKFEKPLDIFLNNSVSLGFLEVSINELNNVVFSVSPFKQFMNGYYEYFGISVLRAYYSFIYNDKTILTEKMSIDDNFVKIKDKIVIPLSYEGNNEILINFEKTLFNRFSFYDIYDDNSFLSLQNVYGDYFLKDKIVLIGSTLRGVDIVKTPVSSIINNNKQVTKFDNDYGVYVHLNFLNTVLTMNFSKYFNKNLEILLIFLLSILSIYLNLSKSGKFLIVSNISIFGIIVMFFLILIFLQLVPNSSFEIILAFLISVVISNIVKYLIENKDKLKLSKALSEYVSKDIVEEILSSSGIINLEGDKRTMSVFFSDIEGFTTISEKFSPEKLISFLKEYLENMSEIIITNKGFINKYEGDAIMVLWGVFGKDLENLSKRACDTALQQKNRLVELNKKWIAEGVGEIKVRIGINFGDAIIGNIGAKGRKVEFTAIGDSINLASRLEGVNKFYGTYICVSEFVYNETKDIFEYRYLDKIKVKGKDNAISIYELLEYKGNLTQEKLDLFVKFDEAIKLYQSRKFKEALDIFESLIEKGDTPSQTYKERCLIYQKNPPEEDWDGIWVMTEK